MNLCFNENRVTDFDTLFKTLPVLRSQSNVEALWDAVEDNSIDFVVSDHRPSIKEEKELEFEHASFGAPQLKTLFSALNTQKKLKLEKIIEILSDKPRDFINAPKPTIKKGNAADITLFDPKEDFQFLSNQKKEDVTYSPFKKEKLLGKVVGVINKNKLFLNK